MQILPFYKSEDKDFTLLHGDCVELLKQFDFKFNMIFADSPYFLSNGGISLQSGKVVCVNKGDWDTIANLKAITSKCAEAGTSRSNAAKIAIPF